jgi:proteasome lid subunit RPN8/RPN11
VFAHRSSAVPDRPPRGPVAAAVPTALELTPAARRQLERHLVAALPREGCGLLGGRRRGCLLVVTEFAPLANLLGAADRFAVDPLAFLRAADAMQRRGLAWLGFAHGHPEGDPAPSRADGMQLWRHCLQVIVAPTRAGGCALRGYWSLPATDAAATGAAAVFVPLPLVDGASPSRAGARAR